MMFLVMPAEEDQKQHACSYESASMGATTTVEGLLVSQRNMQMPVEMFPGVQHKRAIGSLRGEDKSVNQTAKHSISKPIIEPLGNKHNRLEANHSKSNASNTAIMRATGRRSCKTGLTDLKS